MKKALRRELGPYVAEKWLDFKEETHEHVLSSLKAEIGRQLLEKWQKDTNKLAGRLSQRVPAVWQFHRRQTIVALEFNLGDALAELCRQAVARQMDPWNKWVGRSKIIV